MHARAKMKHFIYEHKTKPVVSSSAFAARMGRHLVLALGFTFISLLMGMVGYHYYEGLGWIDCFLNASMILGGMGEIDPIKTEGGKIFAGLYALYSGLWMIASMGVLIAPVFHRILHGISVE